MSSEEQEQNAVRIGQGATKLARAEFEKCYKAVRTLLDAVAEMRAGGRAPGDNVTSPRPK